MSFLRRQRHRLRPQPFHLQLVQRMHVGAGGGDDRVGVGALARSVRLTSAEAGGHTVHNQNECHPAMQFTRTDLAEDLELLRADRRAPRRALGDNFAFEENVGATRLTHFETFPATTRGLLPIAAEYFYESVQGIRRDHVPSTFLPLNAEALMPAGIEPTQKIVRIERLNDILNKSGATTPAELQSAYERVRDALDASPADRRVIDPIIRQFSAFPGARPSFACFKAEAAPDLAAPDWLPRLIARLGLGHFALKAGEAGYFALMQYTVEEVFKQATVGRPFAVPTVLESRGSEFFFPAPAGQGVGYAVDLDPTARRALIREFLHVRLTYRADHLVRVGHLTGPSRTVNLAATRDAHLARIHARCTRTDYGATMTGEVDP